MRYWNSLKFSMQFGYEAGKLALSHAHSVALLVLTPLVVDDILEMFLMVAAISVCSWFYLKAKRQLREAEMLATAWRIDSAQQGTALYVERMQNLRLQQALKDLERGN